MTNETTSTADRLWRVLNAGAAVVATLSLAVTLVAAGYFAVAAPNFATIGLSTAFSNDADSPFTQDELTRMAVAGKEYSFDTNDRASLYGEIIAINEAAARDGRAGSGAPNLDGARRANNSIDVAACEQAFERADERYVLTPEAVEHLDDVFAVASKAKVALLACALLAAAACAHVLFRSGRRAFAGVLTVASALVLAAFALMAAWVIFDFNGFFAAFHSLFFAAGTWTFSWDSLLICMYPPEFWIGMGAIWLCVTVAACAICLIIGRLQCMRGRLDEAPRRS